MFPITCGELPPKGGVRQQLRRAREAAEREEAEEGGAEAEAEEEEAGNDDTARSFSTGGRKRARTIGEFMQGLYVVGRLSAPELQEGAAAASSSSSASGVVEGLARTGTGG